MPVYLLQPQPCRGASSLFRPVDFWPTIGNTDGWLVDRLRIFEEGAVVNHLFIHHLPGTEPAQFEVSREDQKRAAPVEIVSPLDVPVEGRPDSHLMWEMRWYLEDFLDYPFPPNTDRAEHVLDALSGWGRQAFDALWVQGRQGVNRGPAS